MPETIRAPHAVVVDKIVYVTGDSRFIHSYDPGTKKWDKLSLYRYWHFTMTEFNDKLTLVGGMFAGKASSKVAVYESKKWKRPYPRMITPREYPAVSTYNKYLVVAGGSDGVDLDSVEILDTSTCYYQWHSTTPLPLHCRRMTSAVIQNTVYLLGGTLDKQVLSVSLPALTQTDNPPIQWYKLPDVPLDNSVAIAVHGLLLAVGGSHNKQCYSVIHVYYQEENAWSNVGGLNAEQEDVLAVYYRVMRSLLLEEETMMTGLNEWTK